jgi:hypothetical protein
MHKFLIYVSITSAFQVSGCLLAPLQRQMYHFDSGLSLLGMVPKQSMSTSAVQVLDERATLTDLT